MRSPPRRCPRRQNSSRAALLPGALPGGPPPAAPQTRPAGDAWGGAGNDWWSWTTCAIIQAASLQLAKPHERQRTHLWHVHNRPEVLVQPVRQLPRNAPQLRLRLKEINQQTGTVSVSSRGAFLWGGGGTSVERGGAQELPHTSRRNAAPPHKQCSSASHSADRHKTGMQACSMHWEHHGAATDQARALAAQPGPSTSCLSANERCRKPERPPTHHLHRLLLAHHSSEQLRKRVEGLPQLVQLGRDAFAVGRRGWQGRSNHRVLSAPVVARTGAPNYCNQIARGR